MKVFLSSTHLDLIPHRDIVARVVERLGQQSVRMEVFGARPTDPQHACLTEIADADLFVGIYAHRYGFVAPGQEKSITELEFECAKANNKDILCFIVDDSFPWNPKHIESGDAASRLKHLKDRIQTALVVDFFTSPEDLAFKVAASVGSYLLANSPRITIAAPVIGRGTEENERATVGAEPSPAKAVEIVSLNRGLSSDRSVSVESGTVAGRLDVIVRVDRSHFALATLAVSIAVGNDRSVQEQRFDPDTASDPGSIVVTFSFHTNAFNAATGVPLLHNGNAVVEAIATSATGESDRAAAECRLANADGAIIAVSFSGYYDSRGLLTLTATRDEHGYEWRHGAVTVWAVPVIYSRRRVASISLTLPGAAIPTQTLTAPPYSATWSAKADARIPNVAGKLLTHPTLKEADGATPLGISPSVVALDDQGRDLNLGVLNGGFAGLTFRLDNATPFKNAPHLRDFAG